MVGLPDDWLLQPDGSRNEGGSVDDDSQILRLWERTQGTPEAAAPAELGDFLWAVAEPQGKPKTNHPKTRPGSYFWVAWWELQKGVLLWGSLVDPPSPLPLELSM